MDRRHFLSATAGALMAERASVAQQNTAAGPSDCPATPCDPTPCEQLWAQKGNNASTVGTSAPNPITVLPADFSPKKGSVGVRRLWSSIDPKKDSELLGDLHRGYCALRKMSPEDPRSLMRQTWMHDFYCSPNPKLRGDGAIDRGVHMNWTFLPWHRAFIYFHEKILASVLNKPDFRLPAWDWEKNTAIPQFFLDLGLPTFLTGSFARNPDLGSTTEVNLCQVQAWFLNDAFVGTEKDCAAQSGVHEWVHVLTVGGAMRKPVTAAADPVFYAHHSNVDRFWTLFQQQSGTGSLPKELVEKWKSQWFYLHNENADLVRVEVRQLLSTDDLGYRYETLPAIPDCHLVPFTLTADVLAAEVRRLAVGGLAAMNPGRPVAELGARVLEFLRHPDLSAVVDKSCMEGLPTRVAAELPTAGLTAGAFYMVWLQGDDLYPVGSMGLFENDDSLLHHTSMRIVFTGCIDNKTFQMLLQSRGKNIRLVYGQSQDGKTPVGQVRPVPSPTLTILHPEGYYEKGKEILDRLPIPF